jgi:EpsI family protein
VACLFALCAAGAGSFYLAGRQELVPERLRFVSFPTKLGPWQGHPSLLEPQIEHVLGLDDYIMSDYVKPNGGVVNFYVAYYPSQRKGSSPHSPIVCIPGGGWQITKFERSSYDSKSLGVTLPLNRVIIAQDNNKLLVYYWFVQRGHNIANEYWSKWRLFIDAITKNRTDGALVRLVTPLASGESENAADERLQSFIEEMEPHLRAYLPADNIKSAAHKPQDRQS